MDDDEGKAILRTWPHSTTLFGLHGTRRFIKAHPPAPFAPLVVFGTLASMKTYSDGLYVRVIDPGSQTMVPSIDAIFFEVCGSSLSNLRDKRSRYSAVHEGRGLKFTRDWFAKPVLSRGPGGKRIAWEAIGLTKSPRVDLHGLLRAVRVVYVVPDTLLNLTVSQT